ncbi:hypothetical protein Pfo_030912 [Paulownia fortunei]|nr:hypothetical protein Pfo_030912 [Paulownia fortunei]
MATNGGAKLKILCMYKECMHNHAAQTRGYVLDGCGQFEASGPNGTPQAMVCAACCCHRNFHRRVEVDLPLSYSTRTENNDLSQQHGRLNLPAPLPQPRVHQQTSTSHAPTSVPSPAIPDPLPQPQVHQQTSASYAPTSAPGPEIGRQEMNQPQGVQNCTSLYLILHSNFR